MAVDEDGSGSDECCEVGAVDASPSGLGGVTELVGHCQGGLTVSRPLGDFGSQPDGGEGGFDGVGRSQVLPMFFGEVVERQQGVELVGDLCDRFGMVLELLSEVLDPVDGVGSGFGVVDRPDRCFGVGVTPLGEGIEGVGGSMNPGLSNSLCEVLGSCCWVEASREADSERVECLFPALGPGAEVTSSRGSNVAYREVEDLEYGVVGGKMAPGFGDFT